MQTLSYTSARNQLAKTMQKVCDDHIPILITRSGSESVVMVSLSDFEELQETNYLIKSPQNAIKLLESINEIESMISSSSTTKTTKKLGKKK